MAAIKIDTSGLDSWIARFQNKSALFSAIGAYADVKLQEGQSAGRDPYGAGWTPKKDGGASTLRDTGALEASRSWSSSSSSARVGYGAAYAQFHQTGTSKMVQRRLVPDEGLPGSWKSELDRLVETWASSL